MLASTDVHLEKMVHYAFCNGIVYGTMLTDTTRRHPERNSAVHAPFTKDPYEVNKESFLKSVALAPLFNTLVDNITRHPDWIINTLDSTSRHDSFTGRLMDIYKEVLSEGIKQKATLGTVLLILFVSLVMFVFFSIALISHFLSSFYLRHRYSTLGLHVP